MTAVMDMKKLAQLLANSSRKTSKKTKVSSQLLELNKTAKTVSHMNIHKNPKQNFSKLNSRIYKKNNVSC
jgi:hypothetical protein